MISRILSPKRAELRVGWAELLRSPSPSRRDVCDDGLRFAQPILQSCEAPPRSLRHPSSENRSGERVGLQGKRRAGLRVAAFRKFKAAQ
jgi:hypothetical protein